VKSGQVLSDSDEDPGNHNGRDAPCHAVQQDMFRVHSTVNDNTVGFLIFSCMDSVEMNCKGKMSNLGVIVTAVHIFKPKDLPPNRAVYNGHVLFHF